MLALSPAIAVLRDIGNVLLACGAWSMLFGLLYGEALGSLGHKLGLPTLWFYRGGTDALGQLLLLAVGIGITHVLLGLLLGMRQARRLRQPRTLVERAGAFFLLCGLAPVAAVAMDLLPGHVPSPAVAIAAVMFVMAISARGPMGLLTGPLELLGTLGHVLSYLRLAAVGLLRARHHGAAPVTAAAPLVPLGRLDAQTARHVAGQPDLPAAARLLADRRLPDPGSAAELLRASRRYELDASLADVEHAVARSARAHQLGALIAAGPAAEPVVAAFRRETDDLNLLLALRLRETANGRPGGTAGGAGREYLPGGTLPDRQLAAIRSAPARRDVLAAAEPRPARWQRPLAAWAEAGDLATLHADIDTERLRAELALLRRADLLGAAAIGHHVLAHEAQARNIRLLRRQPRAPSATTRRAAISSPRSSTAIQPVSSRHRITEGHHLVGRLHVIVIVTPELADGYRLGGVHAEQADTAAAAGEVLNQLIAGNDKPGVIAVHPLYLHELGERWQRRAARHDGILVIALLEGRAPGEPSGAGESLRDLLARAVGYEFTFDGAGDAR